MTRGREDLKGYFKAGKLPTEEHFHGLIDSMLHMEDEGFRKTRQNGLEITSALGEQALVTFFRKEDASEPLWTVRQAAAGDQLNLHPVNKNAKDKIEVAPPLLTLDDAGRVGIGQPRPEHMLHVAGFVGAGGRTGTYFVPNADPKKAPLADGKWHVLAKELEGCVAFEVVARASGPQGQGRHALLHAFALNAHNPAVSSLGRFFERWFGSRKRIRQQHAWFGQRCDRLELAWRTPEGQAKAEPYELVICTRCKYGDRVPIDVRVTQLWPVPAMDDAPQAGELA